MVFTGNTAGTAAGAQANDTTLDYAQEVTFGVAPGGTYQATRMTGESFRYSKTRQRPAEINDNAEASQSVTTQVAGSGTISAALSFATYDDLMAGIMSSDWETPYIAQSATTISVTTPGEMKITATAASILLVPGTRIPQVGDWISVSGLSKAVNTGMFKVLSATPSTAPANAQDFVVANPYASDNDGGYATISMARLINSSVYKTYTFREKMLSEWFIRTGGMISQAVFTFAQGAFATASFDVVYSGESLSNTDIAASVTPAPTRNVMDTVEGFQSVEIFSDVPNACVTNATITLTRDGSGQDFGMGHADSCGVRFGSFMAAGSITLFFEDFAQYMHFINNDQGVINIAVREGTPGDTKGYVFSFLNASLQDPQINAGGKNTTVTATFAIEGNPRTGGGTLCIYRSNIDNTH